MDDDKDITCAMIVIENLKMINLKSTVKLQNLLVIADQLIHEEVAKYLINNLTTSIRETLLEAQLCCQLTDNQFMGLVYAGLITGGVNWSAVPRMVEQYKSKVHVLKRLQCKLEAFHFTSDAAKWILDNL